MASFFEKSKRNRRKILDVEVKCCFRTLWYHERCDQIHISMQYYCERLLALGQHIYYHDS